METKSFTVEQIAESIKLDFMLKLGEKVIAEIGFEFRYPDDNPVMKTYNEMLTRFAAAVFLDNIGAPMEEYDRIFKNMAIEVMEKMLLSDLRDLNEEAAKEAMIDGDIDAMIVRLMNANSLSEVLDN